VCRRERDADYKKGDADESAQKRLLRLRPVDGDENQGNKWHEYVAEPPEQGCLKGRDQQLYAIYDADEGAD